MMHSVAWWPTLIVVSMATVTDLRTRRVPNWLVFPFLMAGISVSGVLRGWQGIGQSFAGCGLGLLIYGILFWLGGMGAGDVKLCAAIGAWIGPGQLFMAIVLTGLAGGIMVLCWAIFGGFISELFHGARNVVLGLGNPTQGEESEYLLSNPLKRKMPYAPAIAIGTLISFFGR
jgi:prepilin peptidase CpaA